MNIANTIRVPLGRTAKPVATPSMQKPARTKSLFRRIFNDKPEHSLRLRVISLLAGLWAAIAVVAVGVDPLVPFAAATGMVAGHALSWNRRNKRTPAVSVAVGIFIIIVGVWMRNDLVLAIRGDRIPVAFFLLATTAASSFDLKTRAGLYTQIIAAGIIMFFASEIAFGSGFAPLGIVFGIIVLTFLALAYLEDEFADAEVVWFKSRAAAGAFWGVTGAAVLIVSILAFFLLPWNAAQAPQAPRFTIVPFSGGGDGAFPGMTPEQARKAREERARNAPGRLGEDGEFTEGFAGLPADLLTAELDGDLSSVIELGNDDLSLSSRVGVPLDPPQFDDAAEAVLYVRSAVSSYWRGRTYDQYDSNDGPEGFGKWYATVQDSLGPDRLIAPRGDDSDASDRYLQTFFSKTHLGDEVLTGYEPVAAALPRDDNYRPFIEAGDTYQIVSKEPGFDGDELAEDRSVWKGQEYAQIPSEIRSIHALTSEITRGAESDFEEAARIASYLHQLEYEPNAVSQLQPNARIDDFIFGEAAGTAVDFATAMTLMARSAGLTSRLATGYLPGEYNPLSGASKVTPADAHAWSEIYFEAAGWVPFDPTPRPDLPSPSGAPAAANFLGLANLLDLRIGDSVASVATGAPGAIFDALRKIVEHSQILLIIVLAALAIGGSAYMVLLRINPDLVRKRNPPRFAILPGEARRRVLDTFREAETMARSAGFRRREPTEPIAVYASSASVALGTGEAQLEWLAGAAWQAAYSPTPPPAGMALEAEVRLLSLKADLRAREP
ncbi:MAG: transglutaminase domain-containing protein [Chloroflexi bacterium]|nr:transglutaminase domain-containing protein [Chloroflexota bacterium]